MAHEEKRGGAICETSALPFLSINFFHANMYRNFCAELLEVIRQIHSQEEGRLLLFSVHVFDALDSVTR